MSRRNAAVKRPILPDPQFNNRLATMMVARLMKHGKKSTAQRILSDAFGLITERTGGDPVELFETAVKNGLQQLWFQQEISETGAMDRNVGSFDVLFLAFFGFCLGDLGLFVVVIKKIVIVVVVVSHCYEVKGGFGVLCL
jgi:hypothetical protein